MLGEAIDVQLPAVRLMLCQGGNTLDVHMGLEPMRMMIMGFSCGHLQAARCESLDVYL